MRSLLFTLVLAGAVACAAEKANPLEAWRANSDLSIAATLILGKEAVQKELGSDLEGYFILVRVTVTPLAGKTIAVDPDDFLLRSYRDGQTCGAFSPSQIAGRGTLVVGSRGGGGLAADQGGPVWGPGPGGTGRPQRLPGSSPTFGSATSGASEATARVDEGGRDKENPVLAVLKQKALPLKETSEPVSGLLYFSLEGKHKPKDLALQYKNRLYKLILEFGGKD